MGKKTKKRREEKKREKKDDHSHGAEAGLDFPLVAFGYSIPNVIQRPP
jgi:hypothetical protein